MWYRLLHKHEIGQLPRRVTGLLDYRTTYMMRGARRNVISNTATTRPTIEPITRLSKHRLENPDQ
jgi:hypothetical protein